MKVKITQNKIAENKTDSFWYDGQIAYVDTGKWIYSLEAQGAIFVYFNDEEHGYTDYGAVNEAEDRGYTDKDLADRKKINWQNNNWFEVMGINKETDEVISYLSETANDYDEAIDLLKWAVEERIYEKNKKDNQTV